MTRFCEQCGARLATDDRFCTECGAPISPPEPAAETPAPAQAPTPVATRAPTEGEPPPAAEAPTPAKQAAPAPPEAPDAKTQLSATPVAPAAETQASAAPARRRRRVPVAALAGAAALLLVLALAWVLWPSGGGTSLPGTTVEVPLVGGRASAVGRPPFTEAPPSFVPPAAAASVTEYTFVTQPPGATVLIDGMRLVGVTPVAAPLEASSRYRLRLELAGYEPVSWAFTPGELPDEQRNSRSLFFPLDPAAATSTTAEMPVAESGRKLPAQSTPQRPRRNASPPPAPRDPAAASPVDPVQVRGSRMNAARVVTRSEPTFPDWARGTDLPRYVILELVIDRDGRLRSSSVLRPVHPELERLAMEAVTRWTFQPATRDGNPIDAYFNVSVQFEVR